MTPILDIARQAVESFWTTTGQMSPYLLLGFAVAGVLRVVIPNKFIENHLGGKGLWPIIKASLFGVPLPLCSCGVIPVAMSLRKQGASRGAVVAFLLSTPQTGIDSIFVTFSLMGPVFTIFRPVAALLTGFFGGAAVDVFDKAKNETRENTQQNTETNNGSILARIVRHGFIVLPRDIALAMLVGLIIAAGISVGVPDDFFADKIGSGVTAMLLMMLVGIPFYVCATASVPIAVAMIAKGLSPGAALVFLMTGPATNAAAFTTIWSVLGKRTAIIYMLTVVMCALGSGLILNIFFNSATQYIATHSHKMGTSPLEHISAVVLLGVLGFGIFEKYKRARKAAASKS